MVILSLYPVPVNFLAGGKHVVLGKKSAVMYVGGEVYTLMYQPYVTEGPAGRMTLDDVRRIDWESLYHGDCCVIDEESKRLTVIRLYFRREMVMMRSVEDGEYADPAWTGFRTKHLYLMRGLYTSNLQCVMRKIALKKKIAFLMGTHDRLGWESLVNLLDPRVAQLVWDFV